MSTAFTKVNGFVLDMAEKKHNLNADTLAICLATTASAGMSTAFTAGATDLATGNGYTQGGQSPGSASASQTGGTLTVSCSTTPLTWTASGAGITFRYVLLVNTTANLIIGYYDYGSSTTVAAGVVLSFTPGASLLTDA